MTRLRRFLHLERARPQAPDAPPEPPSRARFGGLDAAGPSPAATAASDASSATSATAARFGEPELRAPDVAAPAPDAQPFVRCFRCESDNSVYAAQCARCGEDLGSPAQRAFNEKLWAERLRQRADEERSIAELRAARERAEAETAAARREMAETLAQETGRRERERLDAESYRDGWRGPRWGQPDAGADLRPLGIRLLSLIRSPYWRLAVGLGALLVVVGLITAAFTSGRAGAFVYVAALVVVTLFAPRRRRWWR